MLRLNGRDYVCDRSTTSNPDNAFDLSSIRIEPTTDTYGSKSGQPSISVAVHRSATLTFEWNKSDHGIEPSFEVLKPVRYLHLLVTPRSAYFICKMQLLKVKVKTNIGAECVGS